jgi:hypothetical protein
MRQLRGPKRKSEWPSGFAGYEYLPESYESTVARVTTQHSSHDASSYASDDEDQSGASSSARSLG